MRNLTIELLFFVVLSVSMIFVVSCRAKKQSLPPVQMTIKASPFNKQIEALMNFNDVFTLTPGKVTFIHFPYFGPFAVESLVCNGKQTPYFVDSQRSMAFAYVAPSYFESSKNLTCEFHIAQKRDSIDDVKIMRLGQIRKSDFSYPVEKLTVAKSKTSLSPKDTKRVNDERKMLDAIFARASKSLLINEPFSSPLESKITSIYGTKRVFNDNVGTQHLGTDFRAKIGTEVRSANAGIVVYTGDLFFGGNTVVIDHGLGIFTSYSHLSKIMTKVGTTVTKNSILGLSGMTGRVNGPHLHWGAKVHGNWVDGTSLVTASTTHFSALNDKTRVTTAK